MKTLLTSIVAASFSFILGSNTAYADTLRCQALLTKAPKNVDIKVAMQAPNKEVRSAFCLVSGVMAQRLGVDGKFYSIKFELRLPNYWQGRFAYQFNEGNGGVVKPALGAATGLLSSQHAINQGFAVVSSNAGHDAKSYPEAGLAGGVAFAHDTEALRDYAYGAVQKLNPVARSLVESYYQSPIKYSYGIGQSNGGRLAMVAATRFPTMFDGLLVGSPGFNAPKAALQHAWDVQVLHRVNDDISQSLTKRDLDFFTRRMLNQCDALDGIHDDMIFASDACQTIFEPKALVCKSDLDRDCLPLTKVAALIQMHKGPHNSKNQALYTSWIYDAGMRSNNWRMWKVESDISAWSNKPVGLVMGAASLAHIYTTPYANIKGDLFSFEKYLLSFDFDKDAPKIYATDERIKESAMTVITPPDAVKPKLTGFKQHGGKMMVFHGNSDPVFSIKDTIRWYDFLDFGLGGSAQEFVKFYRIPGMPHGQGGASADQFNMLQPLIDWVEIDKEPQAVIASTRLDNPEITSRMAGLTRPLCPYPAYAHYRSGNYLNASSFSCAITK
ncbi:feruloyl esterase [Marinomonas ushuaiensis DSM 15871]|uniref:Feruloyl esterase n=1 Tax=Marinomonas ushuaiensis DSM 15871 TaxID=1122207 RepID=X7E8B9_9GAMM|nr:tannase/feruloyl esterase family alpha/beta hydrolase [Marinomonas ushuaiensis]ETX12222.1 feruloyl esterase [Marinomonas ushuaiensis DSM 15871]